MEKKKKNASQIKNLRNNYIRFPLDLKPEVLTAFKAACAANHTTPTTEIKKFIARYVSHHGDPAHTVSVEVELSAAQCRLARNAGIDLNDVLVNALSEKFDGD